MKRYGSAANYLINSIIEGAVRLGASRQELLTRSGLKESELKDACARQPGHIALALWRISEQLLDCPLVPFKVGIQSTRLHRSAITSLVEACSTLGEALELGMRYQHVTQDMVHAQLKFRDKFGIMSIECPKEDREPLRPQIERQVAFIIGIATNLAPEGVSYHSGAVAEFSYSPIAPIADYEEIMGIPVRFNCASNQLVFPKEIMAFRNFSASQEVRSCLLPLVKQQERELVSGQAIKTQVRNAIVELMSMDNKHVVSDIELVAEHLNLSVRTLQRRLKENKTSFSEIFDDERKKQALQWMQRPNLSLDEISYNLGFNHVTGFYNAFNRWTGQAPNRYRKQQLQKSL